jgi:hypothetical protein
VKYTIVGMIPPRPGSRVGTLIFDPAENPPTLSVIVDYHWLVATHARVGGQVSFMPDALRYHWEDLPIELQKKGLMDELFPGVSRVLIARYLK